MKIFVSFLQSQKKHPIPAYEFWQYYIKNGIEEAGHEWIEHPDIDWAQGLVPQSKAEHANWKEDAWEKTVNCLKQHGSALFLSYLYPEQIDISAITEIKKLGIPCVNFYCDNVRQFAKLPPQFAVFDLNWVPEYKAVDLYKKSGYAYINLPMPMWIPPQMRTPKNESNSQITFIGSKDIQRLRFFEEVVGKNAGLDLHIYGNGWDNTIAENIPATTSSLNKISNQFSFILQNGPVAYTRKIRQRNNFAVPGDKLKAKLQGPINFETYNRLTAESMITVGVNRYPSFHYPLRKPNTYSRLRDIEAPMLGACYLTEDTQGLELLYDIDNEIAVYKNTDDFIEKVNALSTDASFRKRLRQNGQQRALKDHSIPRSLNKLFDQLK